MAIAEDGGLHSVMWDESTVQDPVYRAVVAKLRDVVERGVVVGPFYSTDRVWGQGVTGDWAHFSVSPGPRLVMVNGLTETVEQKMAKVVEERGMLERGLQEFSVRTIERVVGLLEAEAVFRGEKFLTYARWLLDVAKLWRGTRHLGKKDNLLWDAAALAPAGWCHVRSSVLGTFLSDVESGIFGQKACVRFREKLNPSQYQRPTSAPKAGNVAAAEVLAARLSSGRAFDRRYAELRDVQEWLWRDGERAVGDAVPAGGDAASGPVFGRVKPRGPAVYHDRGGPELLPPRTVTWVYFRDRVLPSALSIEYDAPWDGTVNGYAFVTASDPEAPPILQWDRADRRNPVSWYTVNPTPMRARWNLPSLRVQVLGVTRFPCEWNGATHDNQTPGVLFVLKGCRDLRGNTGGGLFPEFLLSEYHGVRASIEALTRLKEIVPAQGQAACGVAMRQGYARPETFRVTSSAGVTSYTVDRWE